MTFEACDGFGDPVVVVDHIFGISMSIAIHDGELRNYLASFAIHECLPQRSTDGDGRLTSSLPDGFLNETFSEGNIGPAQIGHVATSKTGVQGSQEPNLRIVDVAGQRRLRAARASAFDFSMRADSSRMPPTLMRRKASP